VSVLLDDNKSKGYGCGCKDVMIDKLRC
jgi:hypothetical protein